MTYAKCNRIGLASFVVGVSMALGACSTSDNNEGLPNNPPEQTNPPNPTATPATQSGFDQVDRTAIPAVATLFVDPLGDRRESPSDPKNAFNLGAPNTASEFTLGIRTTLRALRSSDDNPANDSGQSQDVTDPSIPRVSIDTAVAVISPDVLLVDLDGGTGGLLGVELGAAGAFGGRTLPGDVVDAALQVVVFPGAGGAFTSDYVDSNDVPFQTTFPYLGLPHTP